MASPYTSVSVISYDASPPTDDGAATGANQVKWATIKTKLADTLKTAIDSINANIVTALGKMVGTGSVTALSTDYTVVSGDQGKLFKFTGSTARALTLPDATAVDSPFSFAVQSVATANLTITPSGSQTINGLSSLVIGPSQGGMFFTDGSNFFYVGPTTSSQLESGTVALFFNTAAPTGWIKDTSFDDAAVALTSGTVSDQAGTALSSVLAARTIAAANLPDMNLTVTDPGHFHNYDKSNLSTGNIFSGGSPGSFPSNQTSTQTDSKVTGISVAIDSTARGGTAQTTMDFAAKRALAIRATRN